MPEPEMPPPRLLTADEMAAEAGLSEKQFRARMRTARFAWHNRGASWTVEEGGHHHREMMAFLGAKTPHGSHPVRDSGRIRRDSDESYVLGMCDRLLEHVSLRQHQFAWLVGDGSSPSRLPVDAYYPDLRLVVEVLERQHSEEVRFFDKPDRLTVSGVHRGEQRALYDRRRREMIPAHGLRLVEIHVDELVHNRGMRLLRLSRRDEIVIREKLQAADVLLLTPSIVVATTS